MAVRNNGSGVCPESTAIGRLGAVIEQALDEAPVADVLSILTGAFVGLVVELCRRHGHDVSKPIQIDGGVNRNITIHALKVAPDLNTTEGE